MFRSPEGGFFYLRNRCGSGAIGGVMVRESRTLNAIRAAIDAIRAVGERSFTAYSGGLCFAAAHSIQGAGL